MSTPYAAANTDRPTYPDLAARFGEDPARFLALEDLHLAYARIRAIDNLELLNAWKRVEGEQWGRPKVMKRLDARERELNGTAEPEAPSQESSQLAVADGGTARTAPREPSEVDFETFLDAYYEAAVGVLGLQSHTLEIDWEDIYRYDPDVAESVTLDEGAMVEAIRDALEPGVPDGVDLDEILIQIHNYPQVDTEPDELHPDTRGLVAGEVLILETADRTEYIFPATPAAETPFLMRAFSGEDERTDEPIGFTFNEVARRLDGQHNPTPISEIDIEPPAHAATGGVRQ